MSLSRLVHGLLAASCLAAPLTVAAQAAPADWHDTLTFADRHAAMATQPDGSFHLEFDGGEKTIAPQAWKTDTASPLFNGLFALAQDEAKVDSVEAVREGRFNHGAAIGCSCFATGKKWSYVWTRDLSYALDLGLWRFDPQRSRNSLAFKQSATRGSVKPGEFVMQDTGSGGSWPVSTDRMVWFIGASRLLDDKAFNETFGQTLVDTLAQERLYTYDADVGLYRGETSFLDWRDQTYPAWAAKDVTFIAQSFALSTNVLHYEALRMAASRAQGADKATYAAQAEALKAAINKHFWREDRGLYMSYIGGDITPMPFDTYDLLGESLAITSGIATPGRARRIIAGYPGWPTGTPVIWPERHDEAIYHNRAIWPFVSGYALRAARTVNDPVHIEHQLRSIIRGAALSGSNMENFEMLSQTIHVEDGKHSGPVINSPNQLWSVGGYLGMVVEGVFGLENNGEIEPKLPTTLVPMLFGDKPSISLNLGGRKIVMQRPASLDGNLLVAAKHTVKGDTTTVTLKAIKVADIPLKEGAPVYAPVTPTLTIHASGKGHVVTSSAPGALYVNGVRQLYPAGAPPLQLADRQDQQCVSATAIADGIESMPTREQCVGMAKRIAGTGPWTFAAPRTGTYDLATWYANKHGDTDGGITASVQFADVTCGERAVQSGVLVMAHSEGVQRSTLARFTAKAGETCTIALRRGFNMSDLAKFSSYTEGAGGESGPVNEADIQALEIRSISTN
ncbi:Six-hairpin glycosidase-like protein [Luteibacter aegosomaticola]|uniref:alpha-L-rhamnosidase-related protein n=1 Tax=Luteibacter aegosomaticola TaxID=2911538 RepID=UPI001FF9C8DF|nr:Six-hairpin glycosidase-like protein [Luteibacter aegosomaticola]UPG92205.1 Six-hairpin glycosidase-like protein [Luteibacter aegosomaticola]